MNNFLNLQRIIKPLSENEVNVLFERMENKPDLHLEKYPIESIEDFYVNILKKNELK